MTISLEEVLKTTKKLLKKKTGGFIGAGLSNCLVFFFYKFYHLKVLQTSEKTKSKEATLYATISGIPE